MSYRDALSPWCIIQHLPNLQRVIIARFGKRNDAEDHLIALRRLDLGICYELVFDPPEPHFPLDSLPEVYGQISKQSAQRGFYG